MFDGPILIAYDGSESADHAIDVAAGVLGGGVAEVVHAWEPGTSAGSQAAVVVVPYDDTPATLDPERERAEDTVRRGVARAKAAGFAATGVTVEGSGPIWSSIVDRADEIRPRVIVMGTHARTGLRSALSGSVSHHVS